MNFLCYQKDLPVIKGRYRRVYERTLRQDVEGDTSGDYRATLLKIIDKVGEVEDTSVIEEEEDAKQLYKAMHRVGTDEDTVIRIVTKNSNADRQKLKARYQELYKQDLMKDLRSELSGDFEDTIVAMMMPAVDYDAFCLYEAMKGLKTDKATLIGIICTKNNDQMEAVKQIYKQSKNRIYLLSFSDVI
uniref:Annexin n=1 Tax=Biomphalaria glabrata TaxID=6526 RepID=A0A2C9LS30_BIOGL